MYRIHPSPVGPLTLVLDDDGTLATLVLPGARHAPDPATWGPRDDAAGAAVVAQLHEWFAGTRTAFDLPTRPRGTAFQQRVWEALCKVPAGETVSYAEIAARVGNPKSVRAVAQACAANRLAVAIPCHRVVRSDGALSGYRWGVARKQQLLARERDAD